MCVLERRARVCVSCEGVPDSVCCSVLFCRLTHVLKALRKTFLRLVDGFLPARKLVTVACDELPAELPRRDVVLVVDDGEPFVIGLRCPCGCGRRLEMLAFEEARPNWSVTKDDCGRATLNPSVHLQVGRRSHFWLRRGRIRWC